MSLLEIKRYLMQVKISSLSSLANYFNCSQDVLRDMLMHWIRKGVVCQFTPSANCGSCTICPTASTLELYQWVG